MLSRQTFLFCAKTFRISFIHHQLLISKIYVYDDYEIHLWNYVPFFCTTRKNSKINCHINVLIQVGK